MDSKFTFHNVSINSNKGYLLGMGEANLHSIMYLLILITMLFFSVEVITFTFHNVSINSMNAPQAFTRRCDLHSIMYLLIQKGC